MNWMAKKSVAYVFCTLIVSLFCVSSVFGQGSPNIVWQRQQNSDRINSVLFSPDGATFITGSSDRLINFWRASDGTLTQTLNAAAPKVHESSIEWLALSVDGRNLASCNYKMVKLWRLPAGTEQQLPGHTDWVVGVAFSPNGTYLASASFDGSVKIWRVSDGSLVKTIKIGGEVRSVSFSPDGQYLASGGGDATVRIWRTSDWTLAQTLAGHTSDIYVLHFSPDGTSLASGGYDHTARVWNTSTWTSRYTINASGNVYALEFTADSQQLGISDGESNHILLYRVSTGTLVKKFDQQTLNVQSIAFSVDNAMGYGRADATVTLASLGAATTPPPSTPPPTTPPPTTPPPVTKTNPPVVTAGVPLNIIFQHTSGVLNGWSMNGTNRVEKFKINNGKAPNPSWRLFGFGDMDRDGQKDYVWQNPSGATALWLMDGQNPAQSIPVLDGNKIEARWRVVGVGDFNHDRQSDIVFQTGAGALRAWMMDGSEVADSALLLSGQRLALGWNVVGIADFNHDNNPDLVLENSQGVVRIQLMKGTQPADLVFLQNGLPKAKNWRVAGTADFNADGETDLLLQHNSGLVSVWFLKQTTFLKSAPLNEGKPMMVGWRIVGVTR
jgi:hypothetical protein